MGSIANIKKQVIEQLLSVEDYLLMVIDPGIPGVVLPESLLQGKEPVGLNIGLRMAIPIPDLVVDDREVSGTLSFKREPFFCRFPWRSIIQVSAGVEHLVWVEPPPAAEPEEPPAPSGRPKLRLV